MRLPWRPRLLLATALILSSPTLPAAPLTLTVPLPEARAALAALKARGPLPPGGVILEIPAGIYRLSSTLALTAADSGTATAPIIWRASPGAHVIVSGGRVIADWQPVADPAIAARLPVASRSSVLTADLRAAGVTDFGRIEQRGSPGLELFFNGRRMNRARYPNEGWLLTAGVPQTGAKRFLEGLAREKRFDGVPVGRHYGRITYAGDRPASWAPDAEIYPKATGSGTGTTLSNASSPSTPPAARSPSPSRTMATATPPTSATASSTSSRNSINPASGISIVKPVGFISILPPR